MRQIPQKEHDDYLSGDIPAQDVDQRRETKNNNKNLIYLTTAIVLITALVILFLKTNNPKIAGVQQQQYSTEDREKFISSVHAADTSTNDYHKHEELTFSYPTVGIPVPGNKYNSTKVAEKDLAAFDEELLRILKPFNDTDCEFARYGDMDPVNTGGEGGYVVCKNFIRQSSAIVNVGINGFDAFGCAVSTIGGFENAQYDCINPTPTDCPSNKGRNHIHKVCLGTETENHLGQQFATFEEIIRENNLQNKSMFFKIDCEGCEYPGLKYIPTERLEQIDQMVGEFHLYPIFHEEWGILDILRSLTEKFVVVNLHMTNFACTDSPLRRLKALAIEYTLVSKRLITKRSESQSFKLHPLNTPSYKPSPDCQIQA